MRPMRACLKSLGGCVAAVIMAAMPLCLAHAAELRDLRVWAAPSHTRLVLDAQGPLNYTISQSSGQVTVDLRHARLGGSFSEPAAQGLYQGISHSRRGDRLKLVAKVAPDSRLKSFVLKPTAGTDYRLVLDLYPGGKTSTDRSSHRHSRAGDEVVASSREAAVLLKAERKVVVCVDPGHGGKDSGAIGPDGTMEKNVTLAVARDLAAQINRQPGMKAVLTRNGDYYIPLKQRYEIARENKADLFVSIHADSYTSNDAKGSSVWVLSPRGKTSEAARVLADRENADLIGGTTLDGMDDSLAKVVLDLQQSWAIQASDVVARNVLKALAKLGPTHRGYVEKANFVVLRSPDVPSILVETAFISNPVEERKLRNPVHQEKLARAVMKGVKSYFESTPPQGTWFAAQAARRAGIDLAAASAPSSQHQAGARVRDMHRVGRGESLSSIAKQYGISVGALKSANQMNNNTIRAGTVLTIPTT